MAEIRIETLTKSFGDFTAVRGSDFTIRDGEFFVLGDNRDASIDSRCWGVLRGSEVAGRPLWRVLPPSRWGAVGARSE